MESLTCTRCGKELSLFDVDWANDFNRDFLCGMCLYDKIHAIINPVF